MPMGFQDASRGVIESQAKQLDVFINALELYNSQTDPLISLLTQDYITQTAQVPQGPLEMRIEAQGVQAEMQSVSYRDLLFPFAKFETAPVWTRSGWEDAQQQTISDTFQAALKGDIELQHGLVTDAIFTKRTVGAIGTAYRAGFWNGETDVPSFGENTFGSAHYHYKGINTTTLAASHLEACVEDILEHGFGGPFIGLFNTAQISDVSPLFDTTVNSINTPQRQKVIDAGAQAGGMVKGVDCMFAHWVPAGYFAVLSLAVKPLARRLHPDPQYRGLTMVMPNEASSDPLIDAYLRRRVGIGVARLGAGTVRQIVASTSYTNPTLRYSNGV